MMPPLLKCILVPFLFTWAPWFRFRALYNTIRKVDVLKLVEI